MEDSFIVHRSKPKEAIFISDSEDEEEGDLLESSQADEILLDRTKMIPYRSSPIKSDSTNFDSDSAHDDAIKTPSSSKLSDTSFFEDSFNSVRSSPKILDLSRNKIEESEAEESEELEAEESEELKAEESEELKAEESEELKAEESEELKAEESEELEAGKSKELEAGKSEELEAGKSEKLEAEELPWNNFSNNTKDNLADDISDVFVPSGEGSDFVLSSSFKRDDKRDSVDFSHTVVKREVENSANGSLNNWKWNSKRSVDDVKAELSEVVNQLESQKDILSSVNSAVLPDRGKRLSDSILSLEFIKEGLEAEMKMFKAEQPTLKTEKFKEYPVVEVSDSDCAIIDDDNANSSVMSSTNLRDTVKEKFSQILPPIENTPPSDNSSKPGAFLNLPTTESDIQNFGKKAMQTHLTQQSLTLETLTTLHSALKACPSEDTHADDPRGLKVELMPHQKHALAWLLWREREKPSGGILADDMGLGKTLTMISLVLKTREEEDKENVGDSEDSEDSDDDERRGWIDSKRKKMPRGGTLVVCPASLVGQWEKEVIRRCGKGLLTVLMYHGTNRETRIRRIARKDIVITTYNLMSRESGVETAKNCTELKSPGPLHNIKWKRIILDEAHIVRNHKSQTAMGVFELSGKHRWCLTGTPIQNKELDLFSLLKFLRCSPFDDLVVWKRWVDNKNAAGMQRLATMMKSLMLRRTKEQLQEKGALQDLPKKEFETISVKLDPEELKIYKKVALFSSTLFMQFLGQRAEKDQYQEARYGQSNLPTWEQGDRPENQFFTNEKVVEMYRKMKLKKQEVKSHQILVLLLRLRQICCHPGLIKEMLEKEDLSATGMDDGDESLDEDLFSAMEKLAIDGEDPRETEEGSEEESKGPTATSAPSHQNPILEFSRPSSKIRAVLDVILEKVMETEDKAVVVSQWTSMLNIVHDHLRDMGVQCEMLSGSVPVPKRMEMVDDFNSKRGKFKVLLLSLTAGGVGLNLVGGNHLFLIDVHWNPQLEAQACDRVYRVGQTKTVHIYKFVCADTVEERIKRLQDQKLALAENVLTGTRNTQASKLSLNDLKMLFGVGLPQPEF